MRISTLRTVALPVALVLVVSCSAGRREPSAMRGEAADVHGKSIRMEEKSLEQLWRERIKDIPNDAYALSKRCQALVSILREIPAGQFEDELQRLYRAGVPMEPPEERILQMPPWFAQYMWDHTPGLSEYERTLLQAFVVIWVESNQKERLIDLLAVKCPKHMPVVTLEYYFALSGQPITILTEAYRRSRNPAATRTLLERLGCAFPEIREAVKDDEDFVTACESWYEEHKGEIKANRAYPGHLQSPSDWGEGDQLYIIQPAAPASR